MKLARFALHDEIWIGEVDDTVSHVKPMVQQANGEDRMIEQIIANTFSSAPEASTVPLAEVRLLPPVVRPSKNIICIGKNYSEHAKEFSRSGYDASAASNADVMPQDPIVFSKAPCTMVGAYEDIEVPWSLTSQIDYEAELGVIIGRGGRHIQKEQAYAHVFGYTVINDVTARDLQARHRQWLLGKSIDTFCPIGPWLVTPDELDPENLAVSCWVNDELRQQANTSDLIFDVPSIIAAVSASMTLCPGDIIATGTPAGVGIGFDPPRFLKSGDVVRVAIDGIGEIVNAVR